MAENERTYRFREGRSYPLDAEAIALELERIRDLEGGKLTPESIVRHARADGHPFHPLLPWDDAMAGEKWRLHEAQRIATCFYIIEATPEGVKIEQLGNISIVIEGERSYVKPSETLDYEPASNQIFAELIGQLRGLVRRYDSSECCKPVTRDIRKILKKYAEPVAT